MSKMSKEQMFAMLEEAGVSYDELKSVVKSEERIRSAEEIAWDSKTNEVTLPKGFFELKPSNVLTSKGFLRAGKSNFRSVILVDKKANKRVAGAITIQMWVDPDDMGVDRKKCEKAPAYEKR